DQGAAVGVPKPSDQDVMPVQTMAANLEPSRPYHRADQQTKDRWYVALCRGLLRLDVDPPEAIDERVIVATTDGLEELDTHVSVPRHPDDRRLEHNLEVELLYGGNLERHEPPHESFFRHIITLAEPLR